MAVGSVPDTTPVAPPVIVAEGLQKRFGDVEAVRDLSFTVRAGQVVGLLGPNGAGKTTTVRLLTTLVPIDAGSATVMGVDVATRPGQVRALIGLAGQAAAIDEKLTARENLELFGRLYKLPKQHRRRRSEELIERFDMAEFADRTAGTYSGGQRRRLDVAAALVADPPALFLDEPTTGLDPRSRAKLWAAIAELAARGTAIVLTTQYLDEADRLSDEILIIDRGRCIASGTPQELKRGLERDVLDVRVADGQVDRAVALVGPAGTVADRASHSIAVPVGNDVDGSLDILRRLQDGGVAITDFELRRPTLDDVFLTLTGEPTGTQEVPA